MLDTQKGQWNIKSIRDKEKSHFALFVVIKTSKIEIHIRERENLEYLYITKLEG